MGGEITFCSIPNASTTFSFDIDIDVKDESLLKKPEIKSAKILLLSESTEKSKVLKKHFESWGYEYLIAHDIITAKTIIEENQDIDMLLTDLYINDEAIFNTKNNNIEWLNIQLPTIFLYDIDQKIPAYSLDETSKSYYIIENPVYPKELVECLDKIYLHHLDKSALYNDGKAKTKKLMTKISDKQLNIIIAEDNKVNMSLVSTVMSKLMPNANIFKAKNGRIAYDQAIKLKYDLILMDLQMPELDGLSATKLILKYLGEEAPVIIALTANVTETDRNKCLEIGMRDFLAKPLNRKLLIDKLRQHLEL
jgi:CheY-like chemotaxis protein